jgi:uncharacterized protein YndB with AHSA1/START domain
MSGPIADSDQKDPTLEIVSKRTFDAPREVVFEAFCNPQHLPHWWGPKGFTNTFKTFEPRAGGAWRFTMHGPDGATYDLEKRFIEVVSPERVVLQHLQSMHNFRMDMTFADAGGKTELTWRMVFEEGAANEQLKGFITEANEQNFDRLEVYLKTM